MKDIASKIKFKYLNESKSVKQIASEVKLSIKWVYHHLKTMNIQCDRTRNIKSDVKYGFLKTIKPIAQSLINKAYIWECRCECGNYINVYSNNLKNTISCGCMINSKNGPIAKSKWRGENRGNFRGYKQISGYFLSGIKNSAKKRNLEYNLKSEDLWLLFLKQNKRCIFTKIKLIFPKYQGDIVTASLDRIDSSKGYTIDNVQWVHKKINIIKQSMSNNELFYYADKITNYIECYNVVNKITKNLFSKLKSNCKKRNMHLLDNQLIINQFNIQNGCCFLTGLPLNADNWKSSIRTASLDRIDAKLPYDVDNIIFTHKAINISRNTLSIKQYKSWMKLIFTNYSPGAL